MAGTLSRGSPTVMGSRCKPFCNAWSKPFNGVPTTVPVPWGRRESRLHNPDLPGCAETMVVLSATAKTTDALFEAGRRAEQGDIPYGHITVLVPACSPALKG